MKQYILSAVSGSTWKLPVSGLGAVVAWVEGFYGGLIWVFLAVFIADFITGILKSWHNSERIHSKRLRQSVTKLGSYMMLITALIVASAYEPALAPIVSATYCFFILTELKSIVENVGETGVKVPNYLKKYLTDKTSEDAQDEKK